MKKIALLALCSAFVLTLSQCKKNSEYEAFFWTGVDTLLSNPNDTMPVVEFLTLYVNGEEIGELPYRSSQPECGEETAGLLYKQLESEKYEVEARDNSNNVIASSTINYKRKGASVSGGTGAVGVLGNETCEVIELSK